MGTRVRRCTIGKAITLRRFDGNEDGGIDPGEEPRVRFHGL